MIVTGRSQLGAAVPARRVLAIFALARLTGAGSETLYEGKRQSQVAGKARRKDESRHVPRAHPATSARFDFRTVDYAASFNQRNPLSRAQAQKPAAFSHRRRLALWGVLDAASP